MNVMYPMNDAQAQGGPTPAPSGVVLRGAEPVVAAARLRRDGARLRWERDGAELDPGAGSGLAAAILDLLLGAAAEPALRPGSSAAPSDLGEPSRVGRERAIPVDQTHTSVIVDERWVVKIVGEQGGADRSAAILDRLRATGSTAMPEFLGALEWADPEGERTVLALASEYVPDSSDGWTWALGDAVEYLAGRAGRPQWPAQLGALTARMHEALRVEPPTGPDPRDQDRARARGVLERTFALLDGPGHRALPDASGVARRVSARREALAAAIETIPDRSHAPLVTPHGDYHVGQILRTATGRYLVIDFDGDPQWGPEQRTRPDGAARDVAHMLASIDLVTAAALRRLEGSHDPAWEWALAAQQQFIDAYRAAATPGLLDESALPGLVAEQLLLELSYAERYLPEWAYAPDGVITRRYASGADETEPAWNPPALPTT